MEIGWSLQYAKKCNDFPILRYLNSFQNILTAQYIKSYIATFYLKKIRYSSVRHHQILFQYDYMLKSKKNIIGLTLQKLLKQSTIERNFLYGILYDVKWLLKMQNFTIYACGSCL
jgi:hypothetical protein